MTPLSTPPSEMEDGATVSDNAKHCQSGENVTAALSESAIHDKIYET